jgi:tetratricopeptide (TPR) repeat protein
MTREALADITRSHEIRGWGTALERAMADAQYYAQVRAEYEKAVDALEAFRNLQPDVLTPLNNLAVQYMYLRDNDRAEEVLNHVFEVQPRTTAVVWANLVAAQFNQGKAGRAEETIRRFREEMPGNPSAIQVAIDHAAARWDYDAAATYLDTLESGGSRQRHASASEYRAVIAGAEGRIQDAVRHFQDGYWSDYDRLEWSASFRLFFIGDTTGAVDQMKDGLAALDSFPPIDKEYLRPAAFFARAGRLDLAQQLVAAWESVSDDDRRSRERVERRAVEGLMALAEGDPDGAILHLQWAHERARINPLEYLPDLGMAYGMAQQIDSSRAQYERYLDTPYFWRVWNDGLWLPLVYERLGLLHEEIGGRPEAVDYYRKFMRLWQNCDPALRPRMEAAQRAVERLQAGAVP